jgi:hypothetical protein
MVLVVENAGWMDNFARAAEEQDRNKNTCYIGDTRNLRWWVR